MKKYRCIVEAIPITKKGEVKHFQVRIPENAEFISGIETAVRMKSLPSVVGFAVVSDAPRGAIAGELKLQSCEEVNVFYATDAVDQSAKENFDKIFTPGAFPENVWTHGYKRELEEVKVDGDTTVLAGLYRDKMGAMQNRDISYDVFLYVWYKLKTKKDDHQPCA
jgi:hypothetical protein